MGFFRKNEIEKLKLPKTQPRKSIPYHELESRYGDVPLGYESAGFYPVDRKDIDQKPHPQYTERPKVLS